MFKNRPSFRFAIVATVLIALAAITATATRGTPFAFIDSVQEFFGMASVTTPTRTVAPMRQLAETTNLLAPAPQPMFFVDSVILAWEFNAALGSEATIASTTTDTNLNSSSVSRGAGLNASALGNAFSATDYTLTGTFANAVTNNDYVQFTIAPKSGFKTSLSALDANFRRSSTGPDTFQWQYSLDGFATAGVNISTAITYTNTTTNGIAQTQINLTGIPALQNVSNPTVITIRLYGYNAGAITGTFALGRLAGNDLAITGSTAPIPSGSITMNGNGLPIANGSITPSTGNFTDFGSLTVGTSIARGLVIGNAHATQPLNLTGTPFVAISGPAAGDFSVTLQPTSPVPANSGGCQFNCLPNDAPKAAGDYTIQFLPTAAGTRSATVTIANSDNANNPFTFAIQGTGVAPPPTISLNPSTAFDFGSVNVGSNSSTTTSTVTGADLTTTLTCTSSTAEFQLSPNGLAGSWGGGVGFTPTSGAVSATLHIRFVPTNPGVVNGNVTCSSTGATNAVRNLDGTGFSTLTVTKNGTGTGTVTSGDSAINCGATCSANYTSFVALTHMTATADPGSTFAGWSGGSCTGTGTCNFQMFTNRTVTATFNAAPTVTTTTPTNGATGVALNSTVAVTFDQAMTPATITTQTTAGACSGSMQVSNDNFATCIGFTSANPSASGGNTVFTGTPATLLAGTSTFKIRVTTAAQSSGATPLAATFTQATGFTTVAAASNNAKLSGITLTGPSTTISPSFDPNFAGPYGATVANSVSSITVGGTAQDANGSVSINGGSYAVGSNSASVSLPIIGLNAITVIGKAQDGTTNVIYTVNITRQADATLPTDSFRSLATGDWSTPASWQSSHNGTFSDAITATLKPTSSAASILIRAGSTITVSGSETASSLTLSGGNLNGAAGTLSLTGNWTNTGAVTPSLPANVIFNGNGNTQTITDNGWGFKTLTINHTGAGGVVNVGTGIFVSVLLRVQAGSFTVPGANLVAVQIDPAGVLTTTSPGASINVSGNWSNSGTFTPNGSTVFFEAGHTISGNNTFFNISSSATGVILTFEAGKTQTVTNNISWLGDTINSVRMQLRSTVPGTKWNLIAPASRTINYVDVQDSDATGSASMINPTNSLNSGNNVFWFPVPPVLGTYTNQSIVQGANAVYNPGVTPTGTTSITATTSPNFTGTLVANPTTGAVRVTNAGPAGVYTVKVTAFGAGGSTSTTFTLTVTTGPACGGTTAFTSSPDVLKLPATPFFEAIADGLITDVNNDGKQDILVADVHSRLFVRFGNGDGTFQNTADILLVDTGGAVGNVPLAAGDINGDGKQDVAIVDGSGVPYRFRPFLGDGLGGFTAGTTVNITGAPTALELLDVNNDGRLDVVLGKEGNPATLQSILGDGAGGFSGGATSNGGSSPGGSGINTPQDLVPGYFNNDLNVDIAVISWNNAGNPVVAIRLGDGAGGFTSPTPAEILIQDFPVLSASGDFNKDGNTDLIVPNGLRVSLFTGNGAGVFTTTNITPINSPYGAAAGDFNNDGNPDFVTSDNVASGNSNVKFGDGLGAFPTGTTIGTTGAYEPMTGDLNGDGRQDVVFVQSYNNSTVVAQVRMNNCAQPEMSVSGGSPLTEIVDGANSPNATDGTEFGSQSVASGFVDRTYTITNSGGIQLDLTGTPKVVVGGTNAVDFTVTLQPTTPVTASGGTTTFTVRFDPSAGGLRTATLSIANNDSDENPYNFSIQGTGTAAPTVTTNAASLVASTSATLNGSANPNGDATTGWFRYASTNPGSCNDSFGTRAPSSGGTALGSGTSAVAYTQGVTGLTAGTTYFYCAIASNATGIAFGTLQQFTTPSAPTVTTDPASLVTSTTATLNGTANPNGDAATGYFRYATTSPGTCNDSFGTRAPATGGTALGAGTSAVAFNQAITGLTGATTYYYCAIAQNSVGTGFGAVLSFSTPDAPTVTTNAATLVTSTSATLNAAANPNSDAATGWFRYSTTDPGTCNDTFGTRAPASGGTSLGAGTAAVAYSNAISSLLPGNTYYYCGIASNSLGTRFGAVLSFTTLAEAPTVTTNAATLITKVSATLNGTANPGGATTTGWFRYSTTDPGTCNDTFGIRAPASGGSSLGSGNSAVAFNQPITGLSPAITYYYCAIASNTIGTSFGTVMSFSASAGEPSVTTNAATLVTATSATLNAAANPNGLATTGYFRYSTTDPGTCDDVFGTRAPASGGTALGAGTSAVAYSNAISSLLPGTTYYYCGIANNSLGTTFGAVLSFTTPAALPVVTTNAATAVTQTTATLNGSANPGGAATTGFFRYATTNPGTCNPIFGTRAPASGGSSLGSGNSAVAYSQGVTGLAASTTYYYCAIASSFDHGFGTVEQFTTPAIVETGVTLTSGALMVSDDNGGSSADTITLSCNSNNLRINDPGRTIGAGPGTTQVNANTVDVPLAGLTSISVNTFDGSDTLNVDLSGCDIIPGADPSGDAAGLAVGGISFSGGANTTGAGDKLNIVGGSATTQTFNFTNENDGNVVLAGSTAGTITYTGLEPVSSSVNAANVVLNYSNVTETITATDAGGGQTAVDSNVGGESVTFNNPTTSLQINGGDTGDDTINVNGFGSGFGANLTINGGTGNDVVNLNTNITFASGNSLDVDLINDNASPGVDTINVGTSASLQLSGAGTATLNASRNVTTGSSSSLTTANGNVTITANPAGTTTGAFTGVSISGTVEATGSGKVTVAGKGGDSGASKYGVVVGGGIVRGGTGPGLKTEVTGTGASNGAIGAHGVFVNDFSSITSIGGDVLVTGTGGAGGGGTDNYGVIVFGTNGVITSGGTGAVTVNGFGGSAVSKNFGVIPHTGGTITSGGSGAVIVNGTGGPGVFGVGVEVFRNGKITSGGGTVDVTGTSNSSDGVLLTTDVVDALISSGGGAVTVTGVPGPGAVGIILNQSVGGQSRISSGSNANITLIADTMTLDNGNTAVDAGLGAVTIRQFTNNIAVDLGGADSATLLGLTDAELDKVTAATLNIGNVNTGDIITTTAITRSAATVMNLTSGSSIVINSGQIDSGGGNVTVSPNAAGFLFVGNSGVDATTGAASTFKLASGRTLRIFINSATVDSGYSQLNVAGRVDITGTSLVFTPGSTPTALASYTIINNDGTADAITGEFTGLPDEFVIANFLGSGLNARIDYQGGDGNDCVITMLAPLPEIQFSAPQFYEDESQTAVVTITRAGDLTNPSSVSFNTAPGGSATGGATCTGTVDYVVPGSPLPRTINFGANVGTQTVLINICGETTPETPETLNLALSGATNANLGTQTTAVLNINDTASQFLSVIPHQPIDMTLGSAATPYSSDIVVAGAPNIIGGMRVTLYDIWHDNPDNIDVLLVGPQGQKYILMADVGGPFLIGQGAPVTLTFSDIAPAALDDSATLATGHFRPTSCETPVLNFFGPAPVGPYVEPGCAFVRPPSKTLFGTPPTGFGMTNPNGTWKLFVRDDNGSLRPVEAAQTVVGSISGGWGLEFLAPTAADVSIGGRVLTDTGRGIRGAVVTVTGNSLVSPISVMTGVNGRYTVPGLTAGETYVVTVRSRRFFFDQPSRVITLNDNVADADFIGSSGTGREQ